MEKKDFPKGTKPREIFVYTCERIAEPLIPLGYKYRKSKNDIYKKDGIFVFSFYFSPSIRFGSTTFTAFFDVSSQVIAQWRSEQEGTEETYDGIVGTSIARLTHRYDDFPRYEVSTLLERERSIQEISGQIQDYALPFFARFSNLPKLLDDVEQEGFFPHRKGKIGVVVAPQHFHAVHTNGGPALMVGAFAVTGGKILDVAPECRAQVVILQFVPDSTPSGYSTV